MTGSTDTPHGSGTDVEARSEIARFLGKEVWPADRATLVAIAVDNDATDAVLSRLGSLPEGRTFTNVQEVAVELGLADPAPEGPGAD